MRILYNPVYSCRNIDSAPSLNFFKAFAESVLKKYPDTVFYLLFPKIDENSRWQPIEVPKIKNTFVIEVPMYESQYDDLMLVSRDFWEMFNERFGKHYFQVCINEKTALSPYLKKLMNFHLPSRSRHSVIINRDQFLLSTEWFRIDPIEEGLQVLGVYSTPTIFQSTHQKDAFIGMARNWLTGSKMLQAMKNSIVNPLGIDCDEVDKLQAESEFEKPTDRIVVNYSHKLFLDQKFIESLALMDSVYKGGRDIELQIVTGSSAMKMSMKASKPFKYIDITDRASREVFIKKIKRAHIFVSNSYWEDFSATVAEQIYGGVLPVLKDYEWSRYLVPEDYPYLFKDKAEGEVMLRYVVDNYESIAKEWIPKLRQFIRDNFDLKNIAIEIYEIGKRFYDENDIVISKDMEIVIQDAYASLPATFTEAQFYEAIRKNSRHIDPEKDRESMSVSKWFLIDYLVKNYKIKDTGKLELEFKKQ